MRLLIQIDIGFVELDANLVNANQTTPPKGPPTSSASPAKKKKYVLNSSDKLFAQLRDQNFAVVGGILNKVAKRINENYEVHKNMFAAFVVLKPILGET
jgi:hypothetical protein